MKYKSLFVLNIVSVLLLLFSAKLLYVSEQHNEKLALQSELIERLETTARASCNDEIIKGQLLQVVNEHFDAQNSIYRAFDVIAYALLTFGILNVLVTTLVFYRYRQ